MAYLLKNRDSKYNYFNVPTVLIKEIPKTNNNLPVCMLFGIVKHNVGKVFFAHTLTPAAIFFSYSTYMLNSHYAKNIIKFMFACVTYKCENIFFYC